MHCSLFIRAVPFKSVGGRRNGRFFEGGEGPNSQLIFPIRLHIISGRRGGGVPNFQLPSVPPPHHTLKWMASGSLIQSMMIEQDCTIC